MTTTFLILTLFLILVSVSMIVIILVQRPQGGGLAGAFGGAGGGGTESVFGGRVGDALTWATVVAFLIYLSVAITLNKIDSSPTAAVAEAGQIDVRESEAPPIRIDGEQPAGDRPQTRRVDPSEVPEDILRQFQEQQQRQEEQ